MDFLVVSSSTAVTIRCVAHLYTCNYTEHTTNAVVRVSRTNNRAMVRYKIKKDRLAGLFNIMLLFQFLRHLLHRQLVPAYALSLIPGCLHHRITHSCILIVTCQ
jgi:hypothetical protein